MITDVYVLMAELDVVLSPRLDAFLEEEAEKIAKEFTKKYKNMRNLEGKEYILVYGRDFNSRREFISKIYQRLPLEVDAFVLSRDKRIGEQERGEDPKAFYIDFNKILK